MVTTMSMVAVVMVAVVMVAVAMVAVVMVVIVVVATIFHAMAIVHVEAAGAAAFAVLGSTRCGSNETAADRCEQR
jgi:hypothetical protein